MPVTLNKYSFEFLYHPQTLWDEKIDAFPVTQDSNPPMESERSSRVTEFNKDEIANILRAIDWRDDPLHNEIDFVESSHVRRFIEILRSKYPEYEMEDPDHCRINDGMAEENNCPVISPHHKHLQLIYI